MQGKDFTRLFVCGGLQYIIVRVNCGFSATEGAKATIEAFDWSKIEKCCT